MSVEVSQPTPETMPVPETSHILQSATVSSYLLDPPSKTSIKKDVVPFPDRRRGTSDLEQASRALVRAVQYLTYEQRAGNATSVRANRQAIMILCSCVERLAEMERREPARMTLVSWLRGLRMV